MRWQVCLILGIGLSSLSAHSADICNAMFCYKNNQIVMQDSYKQQMKKMGLVVDMDPVSIQPAPRIPSPPSAPALQSARQAMQVTQPFPPGLTGSAIPTQGPNSAESSTVPDNPVSEIKEEPKEAAAAVVANKEPARDDAPALKGLKEFSDPVWGKQNKPSVTADEILDRNSDTVANADSEPIWRPSRSSANSNGVKFEGGSVPPIPRFPETNKKNNSLPQLADSSGGGSGSGGRYRYRKKRRSNKSKKSGHKTPLTQQEAFSLIRAAMNARSGPDGITSSHGPSIFQKVSNRYSVKIHLQQLIWQ